MAFTATTAAARISEWRGIGPDGGPVTKLVVDPVSPTVVYAGTVGGVYRSLDGGTVRALAMDPASHVTLYAVTYAGAFKTSDSGASWTALRIGNDPVFTLAVSSTAPTTLYATTYFSVFRSIDAGATWISVSNPDFTSLGLRLIVDPTAPRTVYAFGSLGIRRSDDGGASWQTINEGLPTPLLGSLVVRAFSIDPTAPATLYAATAAAYFFEIQETGIFRSTDRGAHWALTGTGITDQRVSALAIDPTSPSTVYATTLEGRVYKSSDSATSWTAISGGLQTKAISCLAMNPQDRSTLYAGSDAGVFRSLDAGQTWAPARSGLH